MVDRAVIQAEEDAEERGERVRVRSLSVRDAKETFPDDFNRSAEEIKSMSGTSAVFKRRIGNEIKKAQSKAVSARIEDELTGYDVFGVVFPPHNLDNFAKIYEVSAPHYAAINAKVSNIVGLGYKFVETPKAKRLLEDAEDNEKRSKKLRRQLDIHKEELTNSMEAMNEKNGHPGSGDTFTETLTKFWRDYEVCGNGYLEISRNNDGSVGYIGHIPAQTMRIRRDRDGFVQMVGSKVQFFRNYGDKDTPNPLNSNESTTTNEILHLKKYSPTSGFYGIPDIIAAQQAIAGNEFAGRFNLDYFENKAVPRHLIILKGAKLAAGSESELLKFFETGLKGQNHRSLFIPLPGDNKADGTKVEFEIKPIEAGIQDASFNNYLKSNNDAIFMAHRVPMTKVSVGQGVNLAIARDADKTFKEQVCAPEQQVLERKLNGIIKEMTDAYELKLNEMTLTDEDTQSKIDERNVKAGISVPNEVRTRKGEPQHPDGNELTDLNAAKKVAEQRANDTANRQRDSERSAGATDSAGEGRNPKGDGRTTS